jgi:hypothetical protein
MPGCIVGLYYDNRFIQRHLAAARCFSLCDTISRTEATSSCLDRHSSPEKKRPMSVFEHSWIVREGVECRSLNLAKKDPYVGLQLWTLCSITRLWTAGHVVYHSGIHHDEKMSSLHPQWLHSMSSGQWEAARCRLCVGFCSERKASMLYLRGKKSQS